MSPIKLQGKVERYVLADDEDFSYLSQFKWYYDRGYAVRYLSRKLNKGKQKKVYMHREILQVSNFEVDHINGNGLDNTRSNLRTCTREGNVRNVRKRDNTSSIYKGVTWCNTTKKWIAQIVYKKKRVHLGYFLDEAEAGKIYNIKAIELFGEFAKINGGVDFVAR